MNRYLVLACLATCLLANANVDSNPNAVASNLSEEGGLCTDPVSKVDGVIGANGNCVPCDGDIVLATDQVVTPSIEHTLPGSKPIELECGENNVSNGITCVCKPDFDLKGDVCVSTLIHYEEGTPCDIPNSSLSGLYDAEGHCVPCDGVLVPAENPELPTIENPIHTSTSKPVEPECGENKVYSGSACICQPGFEFNYRENRCVNVVINQIEANVPSTPYVTRDFVSNNPSNIETISSNPKPLCNGSDRLYLNGCHCPDNYTYLPICPTGFIYDRFECKLFTQSNIQCEGGKFNSDGICIVETHMVPTLPEFVCPSNQIKDLNTLSCICPEGLIHNGDDCVVQAKTHYPIPSPKPVCGNGQNPTIDNCTPQIPPQCEEGTWDESIQDCVCNESPKETFSVVAPPARESNPVSPIYASNIVCEEDEVWDNESNTCVCIESPTYSVPDVKIPTRESTPVTQSCPPGYKFNIFSGCMLIPVETNNSPMNPVVKVSEPKQSPTCEEDEVWDQVSQSCICLEPIEPVSSITLPSFNPSQVPSNFEYPEINDPMPSSNVPVIPKPKEYIYRTLVDEPRPSTSQANPIATPTKNAISSAGGFRYSRHDGFVNEPSPVIKMNPVHETSAIRPQLPPSRSYTFNSKVFTNEPIRPINNEVNNPVGDEMVYNKNKRIVVKPEVSSQVPASPISNSNPFLGNVKHTTSSNPQGYNQFVNIPVSTQEPSRPSNSNPFLSNTNSGASYSQGYNQIVNTPVSTQEPSRPSNSNPFLGNIKISNPGASFTQGYNRIDNTPVAPVQEPTRSHSTNKPTEPSFVFTSPVNNINLSGEKPSAPAVKSISVVPSTSYVSPQQEFYNPVTTPVNNPFLPSPQNVNQVKVNDPLPAPRYPTYTCRPDQTLINGKFCECIVTHERTVATLICPFNYLLLEDNLCHFISNQVKEPTPLCNNNEKVVGHYCVSTVTNHYVEAQLFCQMPYKLVGKLCHLIPTAPGYLPASGSPDPTSTNTSSGNIILQSSPFDSDPECPEGTVDLITRPQSYFPDDNEQCAPDYDEVEYVYQPSVIIPKQDEACPEGYYELDSDSSLLDVNSTTSSNLDSNPGVEDNSNTSNPFKKVENIESQTPEFASSGASKLSVSISALAIIIATLV